MITKAHEYCLSHSCHSCLSLYEGSRGVMHSYTYDIAGNRIRADYGTGRSVQTSYDALNRPENIVDGSRVTRYGYDLAGRAVILMAGNGQTSRNTYDELGRLKQRTLYRTLEMSEGEVLARFAWTHDLLGNVTSQSETWPGEPSRPGTRVTTMAYDANNRLISESIADPTAGLTTTTYAYDAANNRRTKQVIGGSEPGVWSYDYNAANQLTAWEKRVDNTPVKNALLSYDAAGNRTGQSVTTWNLEPETLNTQYTWDAQDRLASVTLPAEPGSANGEPRTFRYEYDYRTRRTAVRTLLSALQQTMTAIVFAGGLSLAEYETANGSPSTANSPTVEYTRGPDMGGGVGGLLYSSRSEGILPSPTLKYALSNGRGDIVAQADQNAELTWTASYEAYGKRTRETGSNADKQRANSKDEDPTGLLNEGFRYRDLETGVWLSRDPAGFVDGPNLYAYVKQNPWTSFDPDGLAEVKGYYKNKKERGVTRLEADENGAPMTRTNSDGGVEVKANHYTDAGDKMFSWFNGPQGEPNSSAWEPAEKYGVKPPTSSAKRNFETNNDPQANLQAFGEAANHPTVKAAGTVARASIELLFMAITGGMGGVHAPLQAAQNGKFTVGAFNEIRGTVAGLDAHHVGQRALMQKLVPGYDAMKAPSILVPKVGHTIKGPNGILSRSTQGLDNARDVIARDIKEIRRVYPDAPNAQLQKLIQMNKDLYPSSLAK